LASGSLVVLQSFIGKVGKEDVPFRAGETVDAAHPAVKKWPELFGPTPLDHGVEQATAAPGERRHILHPRKATLAKAQPATKPETAPEPAGKALHVSGPGGLEEKG
jgi:hypothetical protein